MMKTAAYTICKNENQFVEKWFHYSKNFTYRVLLDTGSTDGTFEKLKNLQKTDKNLILEQKIFDPWRFDVARNYNLNMIPDDVEWCLSPDLDEYFSINTLNKVNEIIKSNPKVTNISCDRLDLYTNTVRVGPPKYLPSNKIHRRHDYVWIQPVYEHLWFKYHENFIEHEIYCEDIYLIHDQDFKKESRKKLYKKMLEDEFDTNPSNCWTLWFLLEIYFENEDLNNYIEKGTIFVKHCHKDEKYQKVHGVLIDILNYVQISDEQKILIEKSLS